MDLAATGAHEVIVRLAVVQFVYHAAFAERDAAQQAAFDQQSKHAVKRTQTHVLRVAVQALVKLFRAEVLARVLMKKLEHEHAWQRGAQIGSLEDPVNVHGVMATRRPTFSSRKVARLPVDT
nr:hypothetical protein [Burkholderia sp. SRS-W-2-2016]